MSISYYDKLLLFQICKLVRDKQITSASELVMLLECLIIDLKASAAIEKAAESITQQKCVEP